LKSNIKKTPNGTRTGDVISDDSDGDDEGDSSANDDDDDEEDDDNDADVFALPGGPRIGKNATGRLAGRMPEDVDMSDADQAVAGAERASTNDSDEEDYGGVGEISDSDESEEDVDEDIVLRKAERDLIAEYESSERPRAAKAMAKEMDDMSIGEDLSRRTSMQSETSMEGDLDLDLDFTQDPFGGLNSNDSLYQELIEDAEGQFDNELASWRIPDVHPDSLMMHGRSRESSTFSTHTAKKVRFEETTSTRSRTSSLSSEDIDPRDAYPDLLDSADTPVGRSSMLLINIDPDMSMDQMETESLYDFDFEDEYEKAAFEIDRESDSEESSSDDCMRDEPP
jgi:hypothetical protein